MSEAVDYQLHFVSPDAEAPIQTKFIKVQACTDAEATQLGKSIGDQFGLSLLKVIRL